MKSFQKSFYTLLSIVFLVSLGTAAALGKINMIIPIVYVVMSIVAFVAYAIDKRKAVSGAWRTKERTLHTFEFLCGWPGAMLAQVWLRHKNEKTSFQLVFWSMTILNAAILVAISMVCNR